MANVAIRNATPSPPPYNRYGSSSSQSGLSLLQSKSTLSPFSSKNVSNRGWKPCTLQAPILFGFLITSALLILALELLYWKSSSESAGGGLAFASGTGDLSTFATFGYLYFPTVLAVCYSMLWSWVDLDVKRLEPWFQLSRNNGASAEDSLLLKYPFDFLPFIPVTAFRRGHWGVFFAGSIMLMVFWLVTPLQSAIFSVGTVTRVVATQMIDSAVLAPVTTQTAMNGTFLHTAYQIAWLDQQYPAYTTSEFATIPFQPSDSSSDATIDVGDNEAWYTTGDGFNTNLTCFPAKVKANGGSYNFDNGKGCLVPGLSLAYTSDSTYMLNYIGYYDNAESDWALQNPNCSSKFSNTFLAVWAPTSSGQPTGIYSNLTALFCETSYHSQKMELSVNSSSRAVNDYTVLPSGNDDGNFPDAFNITQFEYFLSTGVSPASRIGDLADVAVLEQFTRLKNYNLAGPTPGIIGFAVGLNTYPIEQLGSPTALHQSFQAVHQMLFSAAFGALTYPVNETAVSTARAGSRRIQVSAITIARPISIIVEAALGIIGLLAVALWCLSKSRPSHLTKDPASVADIMSMMPPDMAACYKDDGTLTEDMLSQRLQHSTTFLAKNPGSCPEIRTTPSATQVVSVGHVAKALDDVLFKPVRPVELSLPVGATLAGLIIAALAALAAFNLLSAKHNGITLPSKNTIVLSILENYTPTSFATLLEPGWVILNRLLCLLHPFDELREGNARSDTSLETKYTSLPPQLVIWRALKARHFLLAAVCFAGISSNVLAVALSGLFFESTTKTNIPMSSSYTLQPLINGTFVATETFKYTDYTNELDHVYIALANLSQGTTLPAWVDSQYAYIPFDLTFPPSLTNAGVPLLFDNFQGTTFGFGSEPTCQELSHSDGPNVVNFEPSQNGTMLRFNVTYLQPDGNAVTCFLQTTARSSSAGPDIIYTGPYQNGAYISPFYSAVPYALEIIQTLFAANDSDKVNSDFCGSQFVSGWTRNRVDTTVPATTNLTLAARTFEYAFVSCSQVLKIAPFNISVDATGRVLESVQAGPFASNVNAYFTTNGTRNTTDVDLFVQTNDLLSPQGVHTVIWHNDTFTTDWVNSLLKAVLGNNSLVNPSDQLPQATIMAPILEGVLKELFAIILGIHPEIFMQPKEKVAFMAQSVVLESRIFVSNTMFLLSFIILSIHLITAIWYYSNRPKKFLPRMPTSIASIMAYVSTSRALQDFQGGAREKIPGTQLYGYGRFVGTDGKTAVGIERQRYVVPLESQNPHVKKRKWTLPLKKEDEKEPKTWI